MGFTALYAKIDGVEVGTSEALVAHSAERLRPIVEELGAPVDVAPWVAGPGTGGPACPCGTTPRGDGTAKAVVATDDAAAGGGAGAELTVALGVAAGATTTGVSEADPAAAARSPLARRSPAAPTPASWRTAAAIPTVRPAAPRLGTPATSETGPLDTGCAVVPPEGSADEGTDAPVPRARWDARTTGCVGGKSSGGGPALIRSSLCSVGATATRMGGAIGCEAACARGRVDVMAASSSLKNAASGSRDMRSAKVAR